eukprot:scaffold210072_cov19-Tisochrysis_lutea.AAC.1
MSPCERVEHTPHASLRVCGAALRLLASAWCTPPTPPCKCGAALHLLASVWCCLTPLCKCAVLPYASLQVCGAALRLPAHGCLLLQSPLKAATPPPLLCRLA